MDSLCVIVEACENSPELFEDHGRHFELEWPPKSGRLASFPEIDRVEWFDLDTARRKLLGAQWPLVEALVALVG